MINAMNKNSILQSTRFRWMQQNHFTCTCNYCFFSFLDLLNYNIAGFLFSLNTYLILSIGSLFIILILVEKKLFYYLYRVDTSPDKIVSKNKIHRVKLNIVFAMDLLLMLLTFSVFSSYFTKGTIITRKQYILPLVLKLF